MAFFLVKSAANFVAVAVLGTAMAVGLVGPHPSLWLTAGPAAAALLAMAAVAYTPRLGPGRELPLVVGGIAFASLRRGMNRRAELCAVPAAT